MQRVPEKQGRDQGTDYKPVETKRPFELIGLGLISGLVRTSQGNQHICVLMDYCTRWAQAYPIKGQSAAEVTECILKFIYQFEVPQRILTDQGKEFNNINTEVCKVLGIQKSLCVPYYPHTKRLVGRLKVTIQSTLTKVGYDKGSDWDLYLDAVMFGLRTKKHLTTGFSPYYLMFGREARYPSEVPENFQVDGSVEECLLKEEVQQKGNVVGRRKKKVEVRNGNGKRWSQADARGKSINNINMDDLKKYQEEKPRIPEKLITCLCT